MQLKVNLQKTILVVDDAVSNINAVVSILNEFDVIPALSGKEALSILQDEKIDLILLDIMMPEMDGFEVCKKIKAKPDTHHIPVIFLTAKDDEDSIEMAYDLGGFDYVTKPFLPRELQARVKFQLRFQEMFHELEFIANHDMLTEILNRRKFFELAKQIFNSAGQSLYAMMIDIDHFKKINDQYGHAIGDSALKQITQQISRLLPTDAVFGRMGGEEFAILLKEVRSENVMSLAEKIRIAILNLELLSDDGNIFKCSISTGVAQKSSELKSVDELLKNADIALYQAKNKGRNRSLFRDTRLQNKE